MTTTTNTIPTPRRPVLERPADRVTDNRAWFHEQFIISGGQLDALKLPEGARRYFTPVKPLPRLP